MEAVRVWWLRPALRGLTVREAERELRRRGYSRSRAAEFLARHKRALGLLNV